MDQVHQRVRRSGLSLVEVMVAGAILALITTLTLVAYQLNYRATAKQDVHSQAYRSAMLSLAHLRRLLRGAQLVQPTSGSPAQTQVEFLMPLQAGGVFTLDEFGRPRWSPPQFVRVQGERLIHVNEAGEERHLAHLGEEGEASFEHRQEGVLIVRLRCQVETAIYPAEATLYLSNHLDPPITEF